MTDAATYGSLIAAVDQYFELMFDSDTGRFDPKALAVLARSFVQMGQLPAEPDMSKLYTEKFLPNSGS